MERTIKRIGNGKFEVEVSETVIKKQIFTEQEINENIAILQAQIDDFNAIKTEISKL